MSRSSVFAILALAALLSLATAQGPVARRTGRGGTGLRRGGAAQRRRQFQTHAGAQVDRADPPRFRQLRRRPHSRRPHARRRQIQCRRSRCGGRRSAGSRVPRRTSSSISTRTVSGVSPAIASLRRGGTSSAPSTRPNCGSIQRARATSIGARCTSSMHAFGFLSHPHAAVSVLSYVQKAQRSLSPLDKNLIPHALRPQDDRGPGPCTGLAARLPHPGCAPGISCRRHRCGLQRAQGSCSVELGREPIMLPGGRLVRVRDAPIATKFRGAA